MQFEYTLEVISILILFVFLYDYIRIKKLPKRSTFILCLLSIISLIVTLMGLMVVAIKNIVIKEIAVVLFYSFDCFAYFLYFAYIYETFTKSKTYKIKYAISSIPFIISVILNILNPILKLNYANTSNLLSPYGVYSLVSCIPCLIYIVASLIYVILFRKNKAHNKYMYVVFTCLLSLLFIIVQIFFPYIILVSVSRAICIALIYLEVERPAKNIDYELGMFNKNALVNYMQNKIQKDEKFSLIHININNFHFISNAFGYEKSNQLLVEIDKTIEKLKNYGILFRLERDIMVILDRKGKEKEIVNSLQEVFKRTWLLNGTEIKISAPIVCANFPKDFQGINEGLELLDYLSNKSKDVRVSNVVYPTKESVANLVKKQKVEVALSNAVKNKSFEVYYQPIHSCEDGKLVGAEALCRLYDNELGFVPPDQFIRLAESNGCIVNVGNIIFEKVTQFISEYVQNKKVDLNFIDVNLSPTQCMFSDFADNFIAIAEKYKVNPRYINLELTESENTASETMLNSKMNKLLENNFTFSCDDYGTGYSTCSYLIKFPFKNVKLDRTLVNAYFENPNAKIIITNEMKTIKQLGFKIVVEGVETKEQLETFKQLGADYIQGYYYSKPLNQEQFIEYCKNQNK